MNYRTTLSALALCLAVACSGERSELEDSTGVEPGHAASGTQQSVETSSGPLETASAVGATMPAFTARELDGGTWELAEQDGVTMLNLWATWCGPCRYEIPALINLENEYGARGLQVVGVSMDQAGMEQQIAAFARNAGINYKIVHDPQARLADVFETTIIPTTALIDRDGKIVWFHAGIVTGDDPELLEALEAALGENPSPNPS